MADIDDPFSTKLRPRPGAGRRLQNDSGRPAPPVTSFGDAQMIPESIRAGLGIGLNPLVQSASPLLLLASRLRGTGSPLDVAALRRHALDEIRLFEEHARTAGIRNEIVLAARYVLCAALDEAVMSTPWGAQSEWSQHPLLVALHREAWGGEKFFEMLNRISSDPARHIDLMELQYLCLAFGFAGQYQVQERGHEHLADIQQTLYRKIRQHRGTAEPELSSRWRGLEDRRNPLVRYVPWWVIGAAMLAVLTIAYTAYYASLTGVADPLQGELAKVGLEDFAPVVEPVPPPRGRTLKQLLAADERAGVVSVDEQNGRTIVTPLARDLFASASATVNPAYYDALQRVAQALNDVPGRVMVVGHTDDRRLQSVKYQDNFELSRERAVSVVKILERTVANPGRLQWNGVGSTQPRYRPETEPENEARNRRVEIIHVAGT